MKAAIQVFIKAVCLFMAVSVMNTSLYASDMDSAYSQGESFGSGKNTTTQQDAKNPNYATIPNYVGTNVPESSYSGDLNAEARQSMSNGTNPIGTTVTHSIDANPEQSANPAIVSHANSIVNQSGADMSQGHLFCANDSCADTTYKPVDQSTFAQNASALSALISAGSDADKRAYQKGWFFNKHWVFSMQSFKGSNLQCRDMGFINDGLYDNCCKDKGWGQVLGLAGCNSEEKTLGDDKQKDLCVYVGEYCSDKTLGLCNEHKKSYCCFDSILAKVIQEQGRPQLGISFGAPESASCGGLTPAQLQQIDFSKIDFTEYYASLQAEMHIPDSAEVDAQLEQDMSEMFNSGHPS